ncbi:dual specificity protein phosphatase 22-A isoform X1 [Simochromis diagramma]|uniref:dual specificity protein phosphatase 22-A isoform X1 n=1 Tax=Simochromis diagramma TaxID=43689 RepID=UPI001A7E38FD|nr:dual specificity protein phosphatase 22-A isoform X1 [Simochromis diagramma]
MNPQLHPLHVKTIRKTTQHDGTVVGAETRSKLTQIQVVDGLYLGNIRDSENRESLSKNGITHILSVYNNAKPVFEDMTYLCIHAADASSQNLLQHFKECISFIHECRLNGGSCLVHCLAGVSRSTTMVVAYLMTVTHYSWEECLSAVKAVRSFVGPNYGFQQQLQEYQTTQVSEYRVWLRSSFRPSPFNDQEQVGALLSQYTEQQQSQKRGGDHSWITVSDYPSMRSNADADGDDEGSG